MTNRIGNGTTNVSINLLHEERQILGRVATDADESISRFVRKLIITAIERRTPTMGQTLRAARERRAVRRLDRPGQILLNL